MRVYTHQHNHYCGSDLHVRAMYVCILDQTGTILVHKNLPATPEAFLRVVASYRDDLVVAVECLFTWSWLSDLCAREGIAFVLGHALSMKAIHGGKAKNDKIDAHKIAMLLSLGKKHGTILDHHDDRTGHVISFEQRRQKPSKEALKFNRILWSTDRIHTGFDPVWHLLGLRAPKR